jgi:formate hydrogenlyase transcriptional activator
MPSTAPLPPDPTRARYETLLEVAESIAVHRQLSTLFTDLSRLLKRLVPFDFISLTLIDPKERVVRLHILETEQPVHGTPPESTPFEQTPTIAALQSRRPYYIPDTAAEERFPVVRDLLRANGVQSACILPLFTAQRELGGLHFGSLAKNAYSEEDIEFMGHP